MQMNRETHVSALQCTVVYLAAVQGVVIALDEDALIRRLRQLGAQH